MTIVRIGYKGGSGSGNWGHEGRPGKEGGSLPTGKSHGAIAPPPGHGGQLRAEQAMGSFGKPAAPGAGIPLPTLNIPTGPVPEHEEGDRDGKLDYQNWLESQKVKPGLADALAMRKYFADRAMKAEQAAGQAKAEATAAEAQKRAAAEKLKPPVLTAAQKKKADAAAKKAATAAASAAKKKASEAAKAKKKAESEAAKKKKAEEAAKKKAAAAAKKPAGAAKKPASNAAAKRQEEAQRKLEEKLQGQQKVAESVGLSSEGFQAFRDAFATLKAGGEVDNQILSMLSSSGLIKVSGDRVTVPTAARTLLSAILAGDALKAQDAMDKLQASSGKEYIGQVRMRKVTRVVIG